MMEEPRIIEAPRLAPVPASPKPAHPLANFLDEPRAAAAPAPHRAPSRNVSALEAFLDEPAAPRAVAPPVPPVAARKAVEQEAAEPATELPKLFGPRPIAPRASSPEVPKPAAKTIAPPEPEPDDAIIGDEPPFDVDNDGEPTAMEAAELRAIRRKAEGLDIKGLPPAADAAPVMGSRMATFDIPEPESPNAPAPAVAAPAPRHEPPKPLLLPDIALLDDPPQVDTRMPREEILEISQTLERTLGEFGITAKVVEVRQGPVVTRFELKPAAGVKVSRIVGLEHDLAMALRASSIRIQAPIPGKAVVGVEVPNRQRQTVYLRELIGCTEFWDHPSPLAFSLGKTIEGAPFFCDLKRMPHLLIAGATGTGKSVCLNSILCSLIYRQRPDRLKLVMVDPKRVELSVYDDIPHLIAPVVCEPKRAAAALAWAVEQMEERYRLLVEFNVRNIDGYNAIAEHPERNLKLRGKKVEPMPHMVVVVDELADLMITSKADVEESIQRLAQMARAVGIHLILATQRPSVNVITGIIKANFPSRIAFQVSQKVDSRTILDQNGAEALLGRGDMLFSAGGVQKPMRIQGCFVSDQEVERIADHWRAQSPPLYEIEEFEPLLSEKEKRELARLMGNPESLDDLDMQDGLVKGPSRGTNRVMGSVTQGTFIPHRGGSANAEDDEIDDALVRAAARTILEARKGSTSLVQRRLKVGFARAGRLMDMLQEMGIVGAYNGSKPREILVDPEAALAQLDALESGLAPGSARRPAMDEDFDTDAT
jgi:S-DNA-T family DNA segregation ATPase FtsK/SpoIIIE